MMATVVRMPQLAAGGEEAAIQAWLVQVGDSVSIGQAIVEIETEKAVVEYEAEAEGTLAGLLVAAGDAASVGSPIAVLAGPGESTDDALREAGASASAADDSVRAPAPSPGSPPPSAAVTPPPTPEPAAPTESSEDGLPAAPRPVVETPSPLAQSAPAPDRRLFASPLVRRLAAERGIDLAAIAGSGPQGRIVRRDLDAWTRPHPPIAPGDAASVPSPATVSTAADAAYVDVPHTGMRRAIARRLTESTSTVPDFQLVAHCRVDELLALRARINEQGDYKVSVNDLVVKAVARAMQDVPDANAVWTDDATRRFTGVDIAIAVSVPAGLVTPVVRGADRLSLTELTTTIRDLAERARDGRLKQHELEGGSFSVSNLGMYGTEAFSAIINPPHAGILAVGAATKRPVVDDDGALAVATVMTVTLSADHRVLDGALAAQWLAAFVRRIENPLSILI
jgi:pyruvate dehydrogenase E2 component (dihydrolipoamide acetyltransferase)